MFKLQYLIDLVLMSVKRNHHNIYFYFFYKPILHPICNSWYLNFNQISEISNIM